MKGTEEDEKTSNQNVGTTINVNDANRQHYRFDENVSREWNANERTNTTAAAKNVVVNKKTIRIEMEFAGAKIACVWNECKGHGISLE